MLAYRLLNIEDLKRSRSFCPKCKFNIIWYDLVPVISWFFLKGRCRNCSNKISYLYPFIEIVTAASLYLLYKDIPYPYFLPYFLFFSALIVTIRTDLEEMLISRFVTLFLIPFAFIFNLAHYLPLTFEETLTGTIFGYLFLFFISKIFKFLTKKEGIGQGDIELFALIGAFTGIKGCWISLLFGSITGSIAGIILIFLSKLNFSSKIPFGPFLAFGSMIYVLYQYQIINFIFGL